MSDGQESSLLSKHSPCIAVAFLLAGTQTHNEWFLKTSYLLFPLREFASRASGRSSVCSRPGQGSSP